MPPFSLISLIVLLTMVFTSALQTRSIDPMLPVIASELSVSLREAFLLSSAYALPTALMQIVLGPTGDALGKVRVIRTCITIMAAGTILSAIASSYGMLLASRLLTGAAAGGIIPMTMALMADKVPAAGRQAAFGRVMSVSTAAQVLGAALAGIFAGSFGWRAFFIVLAVIGLIAMVGAHTVLESDVTQPRSISVSRAVTDYRRILAARGAWLILGTGVANGILIVGMFALAAPLFQHRGGDGPFRAGIALAMFACGGFALGVAMKWMAGKVALPSIMRLGLLLAGLANAGVFAPAPWPVTAALFALVGFGFFALQNCLLALISDVMPDARGSAVALLLFSVFNGQSLGPVIWGILAEHRGYPVCFLTSGIGLLAMAAITPVALTRTGLPRR